MSRQEIEAVRERYERRKSQVEINRYSLLNAYVLQNIHERQRVMYRLFSQLGFVNFKNMKLVEVGCGSGGNLLEFLRLGFQPENLLGIELLEDRAEQANKILPAGIIHTGDAASAKINTESQDIVFQSVVFSSLLDDSFQEELAATMWQWVKPGGGVLWYDFVYNNPKNQDVRGVPVKRVRQLFPMGNFIIRRVTLAPPIARQVCRLHLSFYTAFNIFPFLRSHVLCWIQKP